MFDTCVGPANGHTVAVSFLFNNTKDVDATNISLVIHPQAGLSVPGVPDDSDALPVPFELAPTTPHDFRFELLPESTDKVLTVTGDIKYVLLNVAFQ